MRERLERLRRRLEGEGLDALLVSQAQNRRYLSGFTGSAGMLLISGEGAVLATDSRYVEQAREQARDFEVVRIEGEPGGWLPGLVASTGGGRIGLEAADLSHAVYRRMVEVAVGEKTEFVPTEGLVESLRAVKDEAEREHIARAVALADAAFEQVAPTIRPGMSELEVAWALERCMRELGSEPVPFDIIVASGPNAALPHHRPSGHTVQAGEPVVIDMGAVCRGYCSDLSRTICPGGGDKRFDAVYDLVLGAQLTAIATIAEGMTGEQADALARQVIEQGGHGERFGHGLGHGIGLAPHEQPRLGRASRDVLARGMVFTVEPGVYIPGWGGVRIEDVVVLDEGGARALSAASKVP